MHSGEFDEWYEGHKAKCEVDYEGSSGNMEVVGSERIWLRSVAKNKLRYTTIISDGDSKAFNNEVKPYGLDVGFIKQECVGHVQKRMYYALMTLKKSVVFDDNGQHVKFGGAGKLTDGNIEAMNVYYGSAIRNNVGDVDGMICDIDAAFFHCLSTDQYSQHQFCPTALTVGASITELKPKMNVLPHIILKSQEIWQDMYVLFYSASKPRPIIEVFVRGDPKSKRIIQP